MSPYTKPATWHAHFDELIAKDSEGAQIKECLDSIDRDAVQAFCTSISPRGLSCELQDYVTTGSRSLIMMIKYEDNTYTMLKALIPPPQENDEQSNSAAHDDGISSNGLHHSAPVQIEASSAEGSPKVGSDPTDTTDLSE